MIVKLQQRAVHIDAADTENAVVEAELRNKVERGFAHNPAITRAHFSAGNDHPEIGLAHQQNGNVQIISDNAQIVMVQQRMSYRFRGGADINKQRCAIGDLAGHARGNAGFFC